MTLDLSPAAAPAPRAARIRRHALMEGSLLLRNGEQLLLALVIPVGILVAGQVFGDRVGLDTRTFPASVLALALWGGRRYRENLSGILVLIGFNTAFGLFFPGISWQGHLGGIVTGMVVMGALLGLRGRGRRPRG